MHSALESILKLFTKCFLWVYKISDPIRIRSAIIPRYLLDHTGNVL
ncbi:hypothetical protein T4D_15178 [Trichinella pseudospiralis]|uniref:Uncharacterized protein n=1 Tax=Trichinella pseudospiralis TaxID=6337 RepID=A0A0V1ELE9_TRIPS|nr:hypothetical protein T4D_15178 [Trichinella pseudospiralis]